MSSNSRGLGRGLGALLGASEEETTEANAHSVMDIKLSSIFANPKQPRKFFDDEALKDLSASIKEQGVLQPILVRETPKGYEIIAGERRFRASKLAGKETIPAIVHSIDEKKALAIALIENIQRENLSVVEEATAYKNLQENFSYTQEELSKILGKSRSAIANTLRLLSLPQIILEALNDRKLTAGHARAILAFENEHERIICFEEILSGALTVRDAEKLVQGTKIKKESASAPKGKNLFAKNFTKKLEEQLGLTVKVTGLEEKGKISFEYTSAEELATLKEKLGLI